MGGIGILFDFERKVLNFVKQERLIEYNDIVVVAVSGGADSSALLRFLYENKLKLGVQKLIVAHLNHKLRGEDSDRDERFVKELAKTLKLPFEIKSLDIRALALLDVNRKESLEAVAHKYRNMFLNDILKKYGASKIATAHNRDDLAETVLMWLARGTSLRGIRGILPESMRKIRPFLNVSKAEILDYTRKLGISFVEDKTNAELNYSRNFFRHKVLPVIKSWNNNALENISNFANIARWDDEYLDIITEQVFKKYVEEQDAVYFIPSEVVAKEHRAVFNRLVKKIFDKLLDNKRNLLSFYHINKVYELVNTGGEKEFALPQGIRLKKDNRGIYFGRSLYSFKVEKETKLPLAVKLDITRRNIIDECKLVLDFDIIRNTQSIMSKLSKDRKYQYLNYDKLELPLYCRKVQQGDKFRPFGLGGNKKLSDYFTDRKIPPTERWNKKLIVDSRGIVCILGDTIDHKYRVDKDTNLILRLRAQEY